MAATAVLSKVMNEFPPDLRTPMWHFAELLEERFVIPHQDFTELRHTVERLARAQEDLATAQVRTEHRLDQLALGQKELTAAQKRTEERVEQLAAAQERTEQAIRSLTDSVADLRKTMYDQFSKMGSRWGLQTESTFRQTIRRIFRDMEGVTVKEGSYGGRQVDVVIRNGEHILLEITSSMKASDIDKLYASGDDYEEQEGVEPILMMASSYVPPSVMRKVLTLTRPIEIFSYEEQEDEA